MILTNELQSGLSVYRSFPKLSILNWGKSASICIKNCPKKGTHMKCCPKLGKIWFFIFILFRRGYIKIPLWQPWLQLSYLRKQLSERMCVVCLFSLLIYSHSRVPCGIPAVSASWNSLWVPNYYGGSAAPILRTHGTPWYTYNIPTIHNKFSMATFVSSVSSEPNMLDQSLNLFGGNFKSWW